MPASRIPETAAPRGGPPGPWRPLRDLRGVGPRRAAELARAGLVTAEDLLTRFPLRYEDRSRREPVAALHEGTTASVCGVVQRCGLRPTRRPGYTLFELVLRDESGAITALWFNQRFLCDVFRTGDRVVLFGKVERRGASGLQIVSPQYEVLERPASGRDDEGRAMARADRWDGRTLHTGRIVPVYERVGSLTPKMLRSLVFQVLGELPLQLDDPLPPAVRARLGLPERRQALLGAHFPESGAEIDELNRFRSPAQRRLILEEFFEFQLGLLARRREQDVERKPHVVRVDQRVREAARRVLPFTLTAGQKQAVREIVDDLRRPRPMNRLLQGDVGAGKTIVALLAALVTMENGLQAAVMAPTEILAEQHHRTLACLLARTRHRVALLRGSTSRAERRVIEADIAAGRAHLVVGTHALVQEGLAFRALGLAVIDEQHRFGVVQRATLREKGLCPDVLVMTATPIPRTMSLTLYGDLDVSTIRDRPAGRGDTTTVAKSDSRRDEVYAFMRRQLEEGRQAYVIYPLVEESEKIDLRAATEMADHLAAEVFPAHRVGLLHGRLGPEAKEQVMSAFRRGDIRVLVSTTVVEVGVDVPDASVMLVEHAERFGLAQLHQLRGRVGRGPHRSYCLLSYQAPLTDDARERLKTLTDTKDGFAIAEKDLELRGPGDFFGTRQSGRPVLRVGDLLRDRDLLEQARQEAEAWLSLATEGDPWLDRARLDWRTRFGLAGVG